MVEILVPGVVGTVVGAMVGFAGAAWIDRRRFERDRQIRQAEDLDDSARELFDALTRVTTEAATYETLYRYGKDSIESLRPAQVAMADMSRATIALRSHRLARVTAAVEPLWELGSGVFLAAVGGASEADVTAQIATLPSFREALHRALTPYARILRPFQD